MKALALILLIELPTLIGRSLIPRGAEGTEEPKWVVVRFGLVLCGLSFLIEHSLFPFPAPMGGAPLSLLATY